MSDSLQPHRRQPIRLPRPWDSPGKNTGVGCHFLLQCMKVKSESEVAQSCQTLRDPMACSLPGSSIHGIFQARVLEWGAVIAIYIYIWQNESGISIHLSPPFWIFLPFRTPECKFPVLYSVPISCLLYQSFNSVSCVQLFVTPWTAAS